MKILKNYKKTGKKIEEFDIIKIMDTQEDVFADLPVVAISFGVNYKEPVLFGDYRGIPTVFEKEELMEVLKTTEIKYFKVNEDKLIEVIKEEAEMNLRLPKGTNTDQLIIDNGQIVWAKPIEEE